MGRDPEPTNGVDFMKNAKDIAALCLKNEAAELFARFIASIPYKDNPFKNGKKIRKRQTWRCKKCKKTYKTKDSHREHEDKCEIVTDSDKNESVNRPDSNRTKENKSSEGQHKKDANGKSKKQKCMFCEKKRVRIYDHYLAKHKIDYDVWIENLTTLHDCNTPKCPQCNKNYNDVASFEKHLSEYHNINSQKKTKKRCPKAKNAKERADIETAPVTQEKESSRNSPAIQREKVAPTNGPATQDKDITGRPNAQNERERVPIQYFCKRTQKFVDASSNESQTHASTSSNLSASKRKSEPSHPNKTVTSIKLRKLSVDQYTVVPNSNNGGGNQRTRNDTGHGINQRNQFQSKEKESAESNGSREGHVPQNETARPNGTNNEERRETNTANEESRKSRFMSVWKQNYQRMLVADDRGKQILYDQFINAYIPLARKGAVCCKRLNYASYRRVDVVSRVITETSTTYQAGVVTTQEKVTELKVIKYYAG